MMKTRYMRSIIFFFFFLTLSIIHFPEDAQCSGQGLFAEDELLIRFKDDKRLQLDKRSFFRVDDIELMVLDYYPQNNVYLAKQQKRGSIREVVDKVSALEYVEYAEPNYYRRSLSVTPNDPLFGQQWALMNIQADRAWEQTTGKSSVVVAIADSGIDYRHEDLRGNLWKNPGEICDNGIDDNNDGYIDNCYGINAVDNSGDPWDDDGHGTHVAGIIGAVGNNSKGTSGVNWDISLMALKFIDANGSGKVSDLIKTIEFAMAKNVRIFNMSFGSYQFSEFEKTAIENAHNILFIAASGNESRNNNVNPLYPASYDLPNIISVGASTQSDNLAAFSNYGSYTVSLVAPGTNILSTLPNDIYAAYSGSSMSTAYVSGVAGLVSAKLPNITVAQLKDRILRTVDTIPELQGKVLTAGRLNAYRALSEPISGPFIFNINPPRARIGSQVNILGSGFGNVRGRVLFTGVEAEIESWNNHKIVCLVPDEAESGPVQVFSSTNEGSNEFDFEVSDIPNAQRFSFSYLSTRQGENYYLFLLNMFEYTVNVGVRAIGASGDMVIKVYRLGPFERRIIHGSEFGMINEEFGLNLESDDFFGVYLIAFSRDGKRFYPMYSNPWGPSIYEYLDPGR